MTPILLAFALGTLCVHLATCALVAWRLTRPVVVPPRNTQAMALLRPVCGLDLFDAETLGSTFGLRHPDLDILFCAASPDDPAVALLHRLIAGHPGTRARVLIGVDPRLSNPKLANLSKGWGATDQPVVIMADSNLLLPNDYIDRLAETWDDCTGLVSSPPLGVRPDGLWGAVECAFLNTNQMRLQLAADEFGFGFAQGKTMYWHRDLLQRMGGLGALDGRMAEDAAATHAVRGAGRRVRVPRHPFAQPIGPRTAAQVWGRQLRWSRVRRDGVPALFLCEPLNGAALPAFAVLALIVATGASPLWLAAYLMLWWGSEVALARVAGWPMDWRDALALPLRDAMLPLLWAATFRRRGFDWRGTALAPTPDPAVSR